MITAVDTNILFDILLEDRTHFANSKQVIDRCIEQGQLVISEIVYAELAGQFESNSDVTRFLSDTSIKLVQSNEQALSLAGQKWKEYSRKKKKELQCAECGKFVIVCCKNCDCVISSRQRMVSDFMIGAHAQIHADLLLSRDRGIYKSYFKDVSVRSKI